MNITRRSIQASSQCSGYWFLLKHGLGPGTLPKDVQILSTIDDGWKTYVKLDRFLSTDELKYYDIKEECPENISDEVEGATDEEKQFKKFKKATKQFTKKSKRMMDSFDEAQEDAFEKYNRMLAQGKKDAAMAATNTCNGFAADMSNCLADEEIEASDYNFGGAFDVEPNMFFTREEIDEFCYAVADELTEEFEEQAVIWAGERYMTCARHMCATFIVYIGDYESVCEGEIDVDFRKIQKPNDLMKYKEQMKSQIRGDIQQLIDEAGYQG